MPDAVPNAGARDERLHELIADYLQAVDAGEHPDRRELLRRHPDLAAELESFFADQDRVDRMAEPIRPALGMKLKYFGDYELLRVLARGGMGVVYQAQQVSLHRIVALKMILGGGHADAAAVQRFHAEAEALASLDHPHIVPIYEVGEHESHCYYTMKWMEGGSLTEHRDKLRIPATDAKAAKIAQQRVAELVSCAARAVHFAHERGILHRDLKPGNILLDARGEPHISDFGLAKRLYADATLTATGAIMGTPLYMSPELASGRHKDVTAAADVYSLGAVLYDLLTGQPPFPAETPAQALRRVIEEEPRAPRTLNPLIHRDLETICLKCLQKDPKRRYTSAEALAADLDHWRNGEAISARPVGRLEKTWHWARRRTAAGVGLAALLLLGTVAIVVATYTMAKMRQLQDMAMEQRVHTEHERQLADQQRLRAETNYEMARAAVDQLFTHVADSPALAKVDADAVRKELLNSALKYYEGMLQDFAKGSDRPFERARAYERMATLKESMGLSQEAADLYGQAIALVEPLSAPGAVGVGAVALDGGTSVWDPLGLPRCRRGRAAANIRLGKLDEAEAELRKAIVLVERLLIAAQPAADPPSNPAGAPGPTPAACVTELALAQQTLATVLRMKGRVQEAEALLHKSIELVEKDAASRAVMKPDQARAMHTLAASYRALGELLFQKGLTAEAVAPLQKAEVILAELVRSHPDQAVYRQSLEQLRELLYKHGPPPPETPGPKQPINAPTDASARPVPHAKVSGRGGL